MLWCCANADMECVETNCNTHHTACNTDLCVFTLGLVAVLLAIWKGHPGTVNVMSVVAVFGVLHCNDVLFMLAAFASTYSLPCLTITMQMVYSRLDYV